MAGVYTELRGFALAHRDCGVLRIMTAGTAATL